MFHLTNGKIYVMETPNGTLLPTENSQEAKEFTYKQAKFLQQKSGKKYSWIRNLMMVNISTGEEKERSNYRGNADAFIGDNDVEFNFSILEEINAETSAILKTSGWTLDVLSSYEAKLKVGLSKYDSALSDVEHAMQEYVRKNGKNPSASKAAKLTYLMIDVRSKRADIKESLRFIHVMQDGITKRQPLPELKTNVEREVTAEYRGRTDYFKRANEILEGVV
jgi:hypothetical protein